MVQTEPFFTILEGFYFLRRALGEREERAPVIFNDGAVEARPRDGSVELDESILALAV